jgi:uncharacterized phosphosugar-binding protein
MGIKLVDEYSFLPKLCSLLQQVEEIEKDAIEKAAQAAYHSMQSGGLLHVFATGHSHMIAEELFYRAGGLVPVNPILEPSLLIQAGTIQSMRNERQPGLAERILEGAALKAGDTMLISSNSGINSVPVEAAAYARDRGLTVIGITSLAASKAIPSRQAEGKKLFELCDIVIDNHVPIGDGLLTLPDGVVTGGASTFSSLFIAQRIVLKIENLYLSDGKQPPVYKSANVPGGTEYNEELIKEYQDRISYLH